LEKKTIIVVKSYGSPDLKQGLVFLTLILTLQFSNIQDYQLYRTTILIMSSV